MVPIPIKYTNKVIFSLPSWPSCLHQNHGSWSKQKYLHIQVFYMIFVCFYRFLVQSQIFLLFSISHVYEFFNLRNIKVWWFFLFSNIKVCNMAFYFASDLKWCKRVFWILKNVTLYYNGKLISYNLTCRLSIYEV